MKFIQTVLIILLVFFGLRIIFRLAAPYIMRFLAKKAKERFENMGRKYTQSHQSTHENGQTSIHRMPHQETKRRTEDKKVGEYIDYEEID